MILPDWPALLPAHRVQGEDRPVGAPRLLDRISLRDGLDLLIVGDEAGAVHPVPFVVSESRRARPGDGAAAALVDLLRSGSRSLGRFGVTAFAPEVCLGTERSFGVDQTNESTVVGERAVVKWSVPATPGPHPAPSLLRELVAHGFTGTPRPWGLLEWTGPGDEPPRLLAAVDTLLEGAEDGWTWTVEDLRLGVEDPSVVTAAGAALGQLLAGLHAALASTRVDATEADAEAWTEAARTDLDRALTLVPALAESPALVESPAPPGERSGVTQRDSHGGRVAPWYSRILASGQLRPGAPLIRVHGDLHVGQILRAGSTYVVTDFDGNPVVPPGQRSRPQPAALDVAGLVQSVVHAGIVLRKYHPELDPTAVARSAATFNAALLDAYRAGPAAHLYDPELVRGLRLRQVFREFAYAAAHLPRWSYVPEAALPALLEELQEIP